MKNEKKKKWVHGIISNIFIAAGGYVTNDYFDTKIDEINRPTKVIVGKTKTRKQVAVYFQILFGIGIIAGIILSILLKDIVVLLSKVKNPYFILILTGSGMIEIFSLSIRVHPE